MCCYQTRAPETEINVMLINNNDVNKNIDFIQALTKLSQVDMIGNLLHRVKARNPDNFPNCGGLPFEISWSNSDCQSLDLHLGTNGYKSCLPSYNTSESKTLC